MISQHDIQTIHQTLSLTGLIIDAAPLNGINDLTPRRAMALPDHAVPSELDSLQKEFTQLSGLSKEHWLTILSDERKLFKERFVAGQLLALTGDPRIDTFNPPMLLVPANTVTLGLNERDVSSVVRDYAFYGVEQSWIEKETPAYRQRIGSFYLAKYPVTNQEYLEFLTDTQYPEFPTHWRFDNYPAHKGNHPVCSITEQAADEYAHWLSCKTGNHYRLPSEAEWEYAAAGEQRRVFPWGNIFLPDHCNSLESGVLQTTAVGSFPKGSGPFGHMDLAGNIEEYVANSYHSYNNSPPIKDDLLREKGSYRIARGGSFTRFRDLTRNKRRHGRYPSELYVMGFRLAMSPATSA